ncbi:MAG: thioesterase family protein [Myxococcota bacterium]
MQVSDQPAAFYVEHADGTLTATAATRGPWSDDHQHGGPPAALLMRAVEGFGEAPEAFAVVRLTVELLQPIAIEGALRVAVDPVKLGGQAQRLEATLRDRDDAVLAKASALRLRMDQVELPPARHQAAPPLPPPEQSEALVFPFFSADVGYHTAVEVAVARGRWGQGPCAAWLRPRVPLVAGETITPAQAVTIAADAANGIAMVLDSARYRFVNPDLTIAMARPPEGLWVGIDAHAAALPIGVGINDCALHDRRGELGRIVQSLLIRPRTRT